MPSHWFLQRRRVGAAGHICATADERSLVYRVK